MSNLQLVLLEPARAMLIQIGQFLLKTLFVLIILILGWAIAKIIKSVITRGLRAAQLDKFSDWVELDAILAKGGIKYSLSELLGLLAYWVALLVTFVVTLSAVNLVPATVLDRIIAYIPNVITSIFIMILGMFAATLLRNIVQTASVNAGVAYAELLSKVTHTIVIAFVIFIILEQLKIGLRITEITLSIALGSVGLGLALAFGLGCRDIAARFVAEVVDKIKKK